MDVDLKDLLILNITPFFFVLFLDQSNIISCWIKEIFLYISWIWQKLNFRNHQKVIRKKKTKSSNFADQSTIRGFDRHFEHISGTFFEDFHCGC